MRGLQKYTMQNTKMISAGLLLVLFFNSCLSEDTDIKRMVCQTCTDALACVSDDKIHFRCEQPDIVDTSVFKTDAHGHEKVIVVEKLDSFRVPNTHFDGTESQDPHAAYGFSITIPKLVCGPKFMDIGLKLEEVDKAGLNVSSVRMIDPRCFKGVIVNGRKWFRVPRTEGSCGNTVKSNKKHALYHNELTLDPVETKKSKVMPLNLPFSCFYPLATEASLDIPVSKPAAMAITAPASVKVEGLGPAPQLTMFLYKSNLFTEKYETSPLDLPLGFIMYVGVNAVDLQDKDIVVVLEDCFHTHTNDFNADEKDPLITKKCAADFIRVAVLETAVSHQGRFSSIMLPFPGKDHEIFLHCSVSLCDTRTTKCKPTCAARRFGRSAPSPAHHQLTMGPFRFV